MSKENELNLNFIESPDGTIPCLQLVLNIEVTDALLMFHITHMYRNALIISETEGKNFEDIIKIITLRNVMLSVQNSIDKRIKMGNDNYINEHYINEHYEFIKKNPVYFDECLVIFSNLKKEFTNSMNATIMQRLG
jgi:hypothetical protein